MRDIKVSEGLTTKEIVSESRCFKMLVLCGMNQSNNSFCFREIGICRDSDEANEIFSPSSSKAPEQQSSSDSDSDQQSATGSGSDEEDVSGSDSDQEIPSRSDLHQETPSRSDSDQDMSSESNSDWWMASE